MAAFSASKKNMFNPIRDGLDAARLAANAMADKRVELQCLREKLRSLEREQTAMVVQQVSNLKNQDAAPRSGTDCERTNTSPGVMARHVYRGTPSYGQRPKRPAEHTPSPQEGETRRPLKKISLNTGNNLAPTFGMHCTMASFRWDSRLGLNWWDLQTT